MQSHLRWLWWVSCSKLRAGERRLCRFNRKGCTVPLVFLIAEPTASSFVYLSGNFLDWDDGIDTMLVILNDMGTCQSSSFNCNLINVRKIEVQLLSTTFPNVFIEVISKHSLETSIISNASSAVELLKRKLNI
jgi:hypothetical protein